MGFDYQNSASRWRQGRSLPAEGHDRYRNQVTNIHIPSPLLSYTNQRNDVEASGSTIAEILDDLNRQFPGIRFRMIDEQDSIRPHMKIFVNGEQVWMLDTALESSDEVYILQALSGG